MVRNRLKMLNFAAKKNGKVIRIPKEFKNISPTESGGDTEF